MAQLTMFLALFPAVALLLVATTEFASAAVEIVPRAQWGARAPRPTTTLKTPVPHVFIHHTTGKSCTNKASCSKMARHLQNYHMDNPKLRWPDIGYSFLVGGDGRIYEGSGWKRVGTHTANYNHISVALSFMGDFQNSLPNQYKKRITDFINYGISKGYISSKYQLHGHRDAACTACPGNALYNAIKKMKNFKGGKLPGYRCKRKKRT